MQATPTIASCGSQDKALIASYRKLLRAIEATAICRKLLRALVGFRKPLHTFARFAELLPAVGYHRLLRVSYRKLV